MGIDRKYIEDTVSDRISLTYKTLAPIECIFPSPYK